MGGGEQPADLREIGTLQRGNDIEHALVVGQDMAGTPRIDRIGESVENRNALVLDISQRRDPESRCGAFARRTTRRILAARMPVRRARIDQQQGDFRGIGVERDGSHRRHLKSIINARCGSPHSEASWSINPVGAPT